MSTLDATFNLPAAVRRLERQIQVRSGFNKVEARLAVADLAGLGHGTIERIARDRVKDISHRVRSKLCAVVIDQWQAEIAALTRELAQMRDSLNAEFSDDEARQVEASLQAARARLAQLRHR